MTIEERATNYAAEIYGWEDAFKSSITLSLIAFQGYKRGAEDERRILTNKVWKYLSERLKPAVLGTDGLVVLEEALMKKNLEN